MHPPPINPNDAPVRGSLALLTSSMPEPWRVVRQGRRFTWTAQALGDPAPLAPLGFELDERAVLHLGHEPASPRSPVRRQQLNFFLFDWARQRQLQWQRLLSGASGVSAEALLPALLRHELQAALRLADRVWAASLNAKLEVKGANGFGSTALLRWVLGARTAAKHRQRRALALRYRNLLVMAYHQLPASRMKWPWCLRRLTVDDLPRVLRHLKLPDWAQQRIASRCLREAFRALPPEQQLIAWTRLSVQLPQRLWPSCPTELEAAEAVLAYLSPLFSFGMPVTDAYELPGDERRLRWVLGQLHGEHKGSWAALLGALRADVPLTALLHGTLPRLREVLELVHDSNALVLEVFTSPLRAWSPARWRSALQDWHHRTMGGHRGKRLRWNGLLDGPIHLDGFVFSSPTDWNGLRKHLDAATAPDWQPLLRDVLRGSAQFIVMRRIDSGEFVAVVHVATSAPSSGEADADWPRTLEFRYAPGSDASLRQAARVAVAALLNLNQGLDWPQLYWRQNWESALREPELAKPLAISLLKTWHLTR